MFELKRILPLGMLTAGFLLPSESWASVTRTCYPIADDVDRDGYARVGSTGSMRQSPSGNDLACPSGYVRFKDDCDDNNAQIHPRRPETRDNNVDDNCEFGADEPEFIYSPYGPFVSSSSFYVAVRSNNLIDEDLADGLGGLALAYDVEYFPLTNSKAVKVTPAKLFVSTNAFNANTHAAYIGPVTGLSAGTVYRAVVRFYITDFVSMVRIRESAPFYTMLPSSLADDGAAMARQRIVQRAIYEWNSSERGEVGYRGTSKRDGTRYGASTGEQWCSEFYTWVTKPNMPGISGADTTSDIKDFFEDNAAWHPNDFWAWPGEYLGLDTDTDGKKNHSAMVLGWDPSISRYWTLEGNFGNEVGITKRKVDAQIQGIGAIYPDMVQ